MALTLLTQKFKGAAEMLAKNRDRVAQPLYKPDSGLEIDTGAAIVLFADIRDVRTAGVADASSED